MTTKDTSFQPVELVSKADRTDRAARDILDDELEARQVKTERLRAKRLQRIAVEAKQKKLPARPKS